MPAVKAANKTIKFRIFNEENRKRFTRELALILWEDILTSNDINVNFDLFISRFKRLYNTNFPLVSKNICNKRSMHPWITHSVRNAITNKYVAYDDFKRGVISWDDYKKIRNRTNNILRTSKQSYYVTLFNNFKNNTKKLWETLNTLNKTSIIEV